MSQESAFLEDLAWEYVADGDYEGYYYEAVKAGSKVSLIENAWAGVLSEFEDTDFAAGRTWSATPPDVKTEYQLALGSIVDMYRGMGIDMSQTEVATFVNAWADLWRAEEAEKRGVDPREVEWPSAADLLNRADFYDAAMLYPYAKDLIAGGMPQGMFIAPDENGVPTLYEYDPITGLQQGARWATPYQPDDPYGWDNLRPELERYGIDPASLDEYEQRAAEAMAAIEVTEVAPEVRQVFGETDAQRQRSLVRNAIQNRREATSTAPQPSRDPNATPAQRRDSIMSRVIPNLDPEAQMSITGGSAVFTGPGGRIASSYEAPVQRVPVPIADIVNAAVNTRSRGGSRRSGGGSTRNIAFDEEAIKEAIRDQWQSWLLEGADDKTVDQWTKGYMAKARDLLLRGGPTLDLSVYTGNEMRKMSKYKMLYRFKPEDQDETEFLRSYLQPIQNIGLTSSSSQRETKTAMASGGSAQGQSERVARTQEGMGATNFSGRFGSYLNSLGGL